jgi:hypothetical protein
MKADLAQFKAEHAKARAGRKARLQEKISQLEARLQAHLEKAKEHRDASQRQARAKVSTLEANAAELKEKAAETRI